VLSDLANEMVLLLPLHFAEWALKQQQQQDHFICLQ